MANPYEAIIGGMTPDQDPAALARVLRGRSDRNAIMQLSGDKVLMPYGRADDTRISNAAKTMGNARVKRDAREEQSRQAGLQRAMTQKYYDQMASQAEQSNKYRYAALQSQNENARLSRENSRSIAEAKWRRDEEKALRMSNKEFADYSENIALSKNGVELLKEMGSVPGASHKGKDILVDMAAGISNTLGNVAEETLYGPEEIKFRNKVKEWVADLRKTRLGTAITASEEANGRAWNPGAGGISMKQIRDRMEYLVTKYNDNSKLARGSKTLPKGTEDWDVWQDPYFAKQTKAQEQQVDTQGVVPTPGANVQAPPKVNPETGNRIVDGNF